MILRLEVPGHRWRPQDLSASTPAKPAALCLTPGADSQAYFRISCTLRSLALSTTLRETFFIFLHYFL